MPSGNRVWGSFLILVCNGNGSILDEFIVVGSDPAHDFSEIALRWTAGVSDLVYRLHPGSRKIVKVRAEVERRKPSDVVTTFKVLPIGLTRGKCAR